ncbi:hypothetical protein ACFZAM_31980 [Streptomyces sp. NPDC008079]|uniref:hypothetical protein n=1 Tax=Streptomyces sp. NPDC008079 TaxID=3364806 RepID=UPI0036ED5E92
MTGAVGVLFVGGPTGGQHLVVPAGPDGGPPQTYTVKTTSVVQGAQGPMYADAEHQYRRHVSPLDDGPLWLYLYEN